MILAQRLHKKTKKLLKISNKYEMFKPPYNKRGDGII